MSKKCAIIPQIKNKDGKIVDSRLFKDLLSFTNNNRTVAKQVYLTTKHPDFIKHFQDKLQFDSNGEPLVSSLMDKANLGSFISNRDILKVQNKKINNGKSDAIYENTKENYQSLAEKAITFNSNSQFNDKMIAKVDQTYDKKTNDIKLKLEIVPKTRENQTYPAKLAKSISLNKQLRSILESNGVAVGVLDNLQQRLGVRGVTRLDLADTTADGLIQLIDLADGILGEQALPEEFSHFALEALDTELLKKRYYNMVENNDIYKVILGDQYSDYYNKYQGSKDKLVQEAAGKLLAEHLTHPEEYNKLALLTRIGNKIKEFFQKFNKSDIERAKLNADKEYSLLAKRILGGQLDEELKIKNITTSNTLYSLEESVKRDQNLLQTIIDNELKRLEIYSKRNSKNKFEDKQKNLINELEQSLIDNQEIQGILNYITTALEELKKVSSRLDNLNNKSGTTLNDKAGILRDIRNYIYSYNRIEEYIREAILDDSKKNEERYDAKVKATLNEVTSLVRDLQVNYNTVAMPLFIDFISPYVGESLVVPFGKYKGKVKTVEELIKVADKDISFFDRWLDSMADSSDDMLKLMDKAVRLSKESARHRAVEMSKKIKQLGKQLEDQGVTDFDWMFAKNSEGKKTGYYIRELNYSEYYKALNQEKTRLKELYKDNKKEYNKALSAWYDANTEGVNNEPKYSLYADRAYMEMLKNPAKKAFYEAILDIKEELDNYLPDSYTSLHNAVRIRKDLIERVKSKGVGQIWESVKDTFIRNGDDNEIGDKAIIKDFEDREVQMLPIYYTKQREGENADDISTDVISTMISYAAMAIDYNEMNKVINSLELGRDILRQRQINQNSGNIGLVEKFKTLGRTVESKLTKKGEETRFIQRLNDFFTMQVYGRYMADEGTIGKVDVAKTANFINKVTSMNNLALNVLSGVANVATGKVMMRIESIAGEFFKERDTIIADKNYLSVLPGFLAEIGSRVKTNKLSLWTEYFNTLQDFETEIGATNFDKRTRFAQLAETSTLFFMNNSGEHWMQNRTSLALANTFKMQDNKGNEVTLWDAMEVVPIDPSNPNHGARLQVKEGYLKADGTEFTRQDAIDFGLKSGAINQSMHGIYNKLDKSAFQRLAVGRLASMYRKWMKPALVRRFDDVNYNHYTQSWKEGYYRTSYRFMKTLTKDLTTLQFKIGSEWAKLHPTEKANIKRALTEVTHFLAVASVLALVDWDGDKERPWATKMVEYQLRRLYTELGALTPTTEMLSEGLRLLNSPAAGINTAEKAMNLIDLFNIYNYETVVGEDALLKTGPYKGYSKAQQAILKSPFAPTYHTIQRAIHVEDQIAFFKQ